MSLITRTCRAEAHGCELPLLTLELKQMNRLQMLLQTLLILAQGQRSGLL